MLKTLSLKLAQRAILQDLELPNIVLVDDDRSSFQCSVAGKDDDDNDNDADSTKPNK